MTDDKTIFIIKGPKALIGVRDNDKFISFETPITDDDDDAASPQDQTASGDHDAPEADWQPLPLILRVTTDTYPRNMDVGFVIGRNPDKCDIVLNDDRVSGVQLHLKPNANSYTLSVRNMSRHGTVVNFSSDNYTRVLKSSQVLVNLETVHIQIADDVSIEIQRPQDPVDWYQYCRFYRSRTDSLFSRVQN